MVATAPDIYKKYVTFNRECELVLYVEALNALYGIMKAALLFYIKFVENLKIIGFQLNPYDPCVANKIGDGAQLTVVWQVDDLKVSHIDGGVVTRMAAWLKKTYERLFKYGSGTMKLNRGMIHEYLGITLGYSNQGKVKIMMYNYIRDIVTDFKQYYPSKKNARTPAANHLFKVRDDQKKLPETLAQVFHTFTARSLFANKRDRPDIHTTVAFLSTRVLCPDDDDWTKLVRLMQVCVRSCLTGRIVWSQ